MKNSVIKLVGRPATLALKSTARLVFNSSDLTPVSQSWEVVRSASSMWRWVFHGTVGLGYHISLQGRKLGGCSAVLTQGFL